MSKRHPMTPCLDNPEDKQGDYLRRDPVVSLAPARRSSRINQCRGTGIHSARRQKGNKPMPALTRPKNMPSRNREIIGHYLKQKRVAKGLTQEQMLRLIGSNAWFTAWSAVERGERNLPPAVWEKVAKALEIDPGDFVRVMLRYTNPWAYGMLFGFNAALRAELASIPQRYTDY
jgi:transcriptional regulator with XRE-family HTH domain